MSARQVKADLHNLCQARVPRCVPGIPAVVCQVHSWSTCQCLVAYVCARYTAAGCMYRVPGTEHDVAWDRWWARSGHRGHRRHLLHVTAAPPSANLLREKVRDARWHSWIAPEFGCPTSVPGGPAAPGTPQPPRSTPALVHHRQSLTT